MTKILNNLDLPIQWTPRNLSVAKVASLATMSVHTIPAPCCGRGHYHI